MSRHRRASAARRREPGSGSAESPRASEIAIEIKEEISIDSLAGGGDGVGRAADGRVVFARLTAPGDRVRITAPDSGGRFLRASEVVVLQPGPNRVEPVCPVFGRCGGCAWQHIAYPLQAEAKRQILKDAIERIGKFDEPPSIEFVPAPNPYAYRGRTRLRVASGQLGYRRWRDHEIEPIESCPVLLPELDAELGALASRLEAEESHSEGSGREIEWELAAGSDHRVQATPLIEGEFEAAGGDSPVEIEVGGERIRISPGGFAQATPSLYGELFSLVAAAVGDPVGSSISGSSDSSGTLLELFAGSGFFTVGLAGRFERVIAVESDPRATRDLEHNLERSGQGRVEVLTARVEHALEKLDTLRPDSILLDPPRSGLVRGAAERLATLEAPRIVYLSCDPATLARDLKILCNDPATGSPRYKLTRLTGVDLFPQTPHVEALAVLDRSMSETVS